MKTMIAFLALFLCSANVFANDLSVHDKTANPLIFC
jgi:hypothetical protein